MKDAVGVFRFRRNTSLAVSLKEGAMYDSMESLCEEIPTKMRRHIQPKHLVTAVFTTNATEVGEKKDSERCKHV